MALGITYSFGEPLTSFPISNYGAKGDGITDDTDSFVRCIAAMKANNGGELILERGKVYRVGQQKPKSPTNKVMKVSAAPIFDGISGTLLITGNWATLKINDGMKYGSFDPLSGMIYNPPQYPQIHFENWDYRAHAPDCLKFKNCGIVQIRNLNLDGNKEKHLKGGGWGDGGIQAEGSGIKTMNVWFLDIRNVYCYQNASDGIDIVVGGHQGYTLEEPINDWTGIPTPVYLEFVKCQSNGRNGCNWQGGIGFKAFQCDFSWNGRYGNISSVPNAGFDAESHSSDHGWMAPCFDGEFVSCRFENNFGPGYVAWSNSDVSNVRFTDCTFHGRESFAAAVLKNSHYFYRCEFIGASYLCGDSGTDHNKMIYGESCHFTDDVSAAYPVVYTGVPLIYGGGENMTFWKCRIEASKGNALGISNAFTSETRRVKFVNTAFNFLGTGIQNSSGICSYFYNTDFDYCTVASAASYSQADWFWGSNVNVGPGVSIDPASKIKWLNGSSGTIAPGKY